MPPPSFGVDHAGRRVEVRPDDVFADDRRPRDLRVRLLVDGAEADAVRMTRSVVLRSGDVEVRAALTMLGRVKRAALALPGGAQLPLVEVPAPGDPAGAAPGDQGSRAAKAWCAGGIAAAVVYGVASRPLRPFLVTAPLVWAAVSGSSLAMITLGAYTATGRTDLWWLGLLVATVSIVKFDPLWWWAGRLWGDRLLAMLSGRPGRGGRTGERLRAWARRWRAPAIAVTYVVPAVPAALVYATAGATGMRLRTFLLVELAAAAATRCLYFALGYRLGQAAVDVVEAVSRYALWLSLALVAVGILTSVLGERRRPRAGAGAA